MLRGDGYMKNQCAGFRSSDSNVHSDVDASYILNPPHLHSEKCLQIWNPTHLFHDKDMISKENIPTPWSRILLQKLIVPQLDKKFPAFYGIQSFITVFRIAHHCPYLIYLFVVYLTMLSVAQTLYRRMIGWVMNNELERIWKEAVVAWLDWGKPIETSIRISGLRADIWTQDLPNKKEEC
jgi:hypothetical protein